jgi:hypothetical protein
LPKLNISANFTCARAVACPNAQALKRICIVLKEYEEAYFSCGNHLLHRRIACSCGNSNDGASLPRGKATAALDSAFNRYLDAVTDSSLDLHSIMVVKDGKVVERKMDERRRTGQASCDVVCEQIVHRHRSRACDFGGKLRLDDKMTSFFQMICQNTS